MNDEKLDEREIRDKLTHGWLHAHLIFEVIGKPAEHIENSLGMLLEKISKEKNLYVIEKKIHEAKQIDQTKDVFSTFSEVEILVNNLSKIIDIIFDYMPSSIEIVEPTNFTFKIEDANALLNDLAARLHQYDAILKKLRLERSLLIKRLSEELNKNKEKENQKESRTSS